MGGEEEEIERGRGGRKGAQKRELEEGKNKRAALGGFAAPFFHVRLESRDLGSISKWVEEKKVMGKGRRIWRKRREKKRAPSAPH